MYSVRTWVFSRSSNGRGLKFTTYLYLMPRSRTSGDKRLQEGGKLSNVTGSVHLKNILINIRQDAMLHSLFYPKTTLHVSGGTTTNYQERKQLYLQHLVFVTPLLLSAAILEELKLV